MVYWGLDFNLTSLSISLFKYEILARTAVSVIGFFLQRCQRYKLSEFDSLLHICYINVPILLLDIFHLIPNSLISLDYRSIFMFHLSANRRSFLKLSLAGAFSLFSIKPAMAKIMPLDEEMPEGRLSLYNIHTHEKLSITYRNHAGEYDTAALRNLNWILRCHYTNETIDMDRDVIEYLNTIDKQFGGNNELHIISGFRSPKYNGILHQEDHHVAKHSLHMEGKAIDFFIPRVALKSLRTAALSLRYGGVGYYPRTGFVHIDSGNFRTW